MWHVDIMWPVAWAPAVAAACWMLDDGQMDRAISYTIYTVYVYILDI
jgi:hypothetical protein